MEEGHMPGAGGGGLEMLAPAPGSLQIDATLGGGGHTERILEATDPDGRLLGLDADGAAIARVADSASRFGDRLVLRQANFRELADVAPAAGFGAVDGCLFDLGLSSFQLADAERGFGFRAGGPLDMRFDTDAGRPAASCSRRWTRTSSPRCSAATARSLGPAGSPARSSTLAGSRRSDHRRGARRPRRARRAPNPRQPRRTHPGDPRLPGPADRGQRGARRAGRGPAAAVHLLRPGGRLVVLSLPLARGPDRQAIHRAERRGCTVRPELPRSAPAAGTRASAS
jgi:16S rRNA (cytosine1402-N4)-methyltransferase